jgi:hypothetical protein
MPYRLQLQGEIVEVSMFGVLDGMGAFSPSEWELVREAKRVMYNFDEVENITFDPWAMAEHIKHMASQGVMIAGFAERPAWFGVSRQIEILSEASGGAVHAFNDRASALSWLLEAGAG